MPIQPIFLLSAVRSGSTLVQRILAAHDGVASVAEPWIALPFAYTLRSGGVPAGHLQPLLAEAVEDFCHQLPRGQEDYLAQLRNCALELYEKAAGPGARCFLDKSPPYCFVPAELLRLFPEGRFVFLWRNPLSIAASIVETWEPWRPAMFRDDLFLGIPRLADVYEANRDRVHGVRFEDLVGGEHEHWRALTAYLGIEFDPAALRRFREVALDGRMGDPGRRRYSTLSSEPQQKWRECLANPIRKEWSRRYLSFLGARRLASMGYDRERLLAELDSLPASGRALLPDLGRLIKDLVKEPVRVHVRRGTTDGPHVIRALLSARTAPGERARRPTDVAGATRKNASPIGVA